MPEQTNQQSRMLASDLLKDSKFCITGLTKAAAEATNTQLRQVLTEAVDESVDEHFWLADIMINKGWYNPTDMAQQLQNDLRAAGQMTGQAGTKQ